MMSVDEAATFMWKLLETQGKCRCPWETFKEVPDELKGIVPVERRILQKRSSTGEVVRIAYREYTESAARELQKHVKFDVVAALHKRGYQGAYVGFRRAVRSYYKQSRLSKWYAR